jgi:RNA polymerase sigma factor (sigma-70 family)
MSAASDEELMTAYVRGDRASFHALFDRWAPRLRHLFVRGGLRGDDADDLVQQTFLQLHRARHDFREGSVLRPWIFTIALNLRRQFMRRAGRKPEHELDEQDAPPAEQGDPDAAIDSRHVRAALGALPEAQREVIMLHWFSGLGFREVAEIVGATPTAVKVRAHRGYAKLRAHLEAAGVTAGGPPSYAPEEE